MALGRAKAANELLLLCACRKMRGKCHSSITAGPDTLQSTVPRQGQDPATMVATPMWKWESQAYFVRMQMHQRRHYY